MSEPIKNQFDAVAQSYDLQRQQLIPCFDDFYGMATTWVNVENKAPRLLDLGAGTGLFSSFVRHKYPNSSLTLIDLSEAMIKEARNRFGDAPLIEYIAADYTSYPFTGPYDAVISSLSIHHLDDPDKRKLFQTIYNLLPEDGIFINADQASGRTPSIDQAYKEQWEEAIRNVGLSTPAIESAIERRKLDNNAPVEDQLSWLRDAGFRDAECIYKYNEFAVFYARK